MRIASKSPEAFRTISEVADELDLPQHVLRFWETKFSQIKPLKRAGGRRYYRPEDVNLLRGIRTLLYTDGFTIKGVQKVLREQGVRYVMETGRMLGQDDRPLPVSHSGQVTVSADDFSQPLSDEDTRESYFRRDEVPTVTPATEVHILQPNHRADAEPAISLRQRAALASILEELLELKFTLDGARKSLAKTAALSREQDAGRTRIQRLA